MPPIRAAVNVAWETVKAVLPENSPCLELLRSAGAGGSGGEGAESARGQNERLGFARFAGGTQGGSMGESTEMATMAESNGKYKIKQFLYCSFTGVYIR